MRVAAEIKQRTVWCAHERTKYSVRRFGIAEQDAGVCDDVSVAFFTAQRAQVKNRFAKVAEGMNFSVHSLRVTDHLSEIIDAERDAVIAAERADVRYGVSLSDCC